MTAEHRRPKHFRINTMIYVTNRASHPVSLPPLTEVIDPGWARALEPVEGTIRALGQELRKESASGTPFLPGGSSILKAFTYPFDQVRVLLVGQDPYPTVGHAMGLAFSVSPQTRIPASLRNIFAELETDLGCPTPATGDLRPWARQGVCLLNRVLTVSPGLPTSHRNRGWEKVTDQAIRALVARDKPLVAVLWGRQAQTLAPLLEDTPIVSSVHPSPLSAHRGFFGSKPFSQTNLLLESQGASPIQWCLPAK